MIIEIDYDSPEALYMQLRNQIILGIANSMLHEGDALPPVRQLAGDIGINMHTVNKAYAVLREEGIVSIDRRRGAVIALDADKIQAERELRECLQIVLAKADCQHITREEVHALVDKIYKQWEEN